MIYKLKEKSTLSVKIICLPKDTHWLGFDYDGG